MKDELEYLTTHREYMITDKCNLSCSYCFEKERNRKTLRNLALHPAQTLSFFGGEPLLEIDSILEWKQKAPELVDATVITNGTLIYKMIPKLTKLNASLAISLDGTKDTQKLRGDNTYEEIIKSVKALKLTSIPWTFQATVIRDYYATYFANMSHLVTLLIDNSNDLDFALRAFGVTITLLEDVDITNEELDELVNQFHELAVWILQHDKLSMNHKRMLIQSLILKNDAFFCGAGVTSSCTMPDGKTEFCHRSAYEPQITYDPEHMLKLDPENVSFGPWKNYCTLINRKVTQSSTTLPYRYKLFIAKHTAMVNSVIPREYL